MINAIFFYQIARWLYIHHVPLLPKLFQLLIFFMYNSKIPPTAQIGKGTSCICGGLSVCVHNNAVIGKNCKLGFHCCIVGKTPYKEVAQIGDDVFIGHNTVICGPVKIDDGAIIANSAVVMKSVPKNAIVAGIPAKIVGYRDELSYNFLGENSLKEGFMPYMSK